MFCSIISFVNELNCIMSWSNVICFIHENDSTLIVTILLYWLIIFDAICDRLKFRDNNFTSCHVRLIEIFNWILFSICNDEIFSCFDFFFIRFEKRINCLSDDFFSIQNDCNLLSELFIIYRHIWNDRRFRWFWFSKHEF